LPFDEAVCYTKDAKNPNKTIPLAIVPSLLISAFIYIVLSLVLTGMADIQNIPVTFALGGISWTFNQNSQTVLSFIISLAALA